MFFRMEVETMGLKDKFLKTIATIIVCFENHKHDREFCRDKVFKAFAEDRVKNKIFLTKDQKDLLEHSLRKDLSYMWQEWRIENADC